MGWHKYAVHGSLYITMDNFGVSAPHKDLAIKFGFTKVIELVSSGLS